MPAHIYLDNTASTPLDEQVRLAMLSYMDEFYGNPSSIHSHGRKLKVAVENARKSIAVWFNVSPSEIFFTSGGTESDNIAVFSSINSFDIKNVITSPLEHYAILKPLSYLSSKKKINLHFVRHDGTGNIDLNHLEELLKKFPRSFVSLMHANNEIGNLTDIETAARMTKENDGIFPAPFHIAFRLN